MYCDSCEDSGLIYNNGSDPDNESSEETILDTVVSAPNPIALAPDMVASTPDGVASAPENIASAPDPVVSAPDQVPSTRPLGCLI